MKVSQANDRLVKNINFNINVKNPRKPTKVKNIPNISEAKGGVINEKITKMVYDPYRDRCKL